LPHKFNRHDAADFTQREFGSRNLWVHRPPIDTARALRARRIAAFGDLEVNLSYIGKRIHKNVETAFNAVSFLQ
jgi:hypothetical protein